MNLTLHIFVNSWFLLLEMIPIGCSATAPHYMAGLAMPSTLVATERKIW